MKVKPEHYVYIKNAIKELDRTRNLAEHVSQYKSLGLTPKRFRWDCTYGAGLSNWFRDHVYPYADDTHIDTALHAIMLALELPWAAQ